MPHENYQTNCCISWFGSLQVWPRDDHSSKLSQSQKSHWHLNSFNWSCSFLVFWTTQLFRGPFQLEIPSWENWLPSGCWCFRQRVMDLGLVNVLFRCVQPHLLLVIVVLFLTSGVFGFLWIVLTNSPQYPSNSMGPRAAHSKTDI